MSRIDDYAWLAATEEPEVLAYLSAERAHYDEATAHLGSLRFGLAGELIARTPPAERSVSWRRDGLVYYTITAEGEEYERIYRHDIDSEQNLLVIDLNAQAAGQAYFEVGLLQPSPDGRLLAYSVDLVGSEIYQLRFRDLATVPAGDLAGDLAGGGRDLPDAVPGTYYGGAWSADSTSFFYTVPDQAYRPDRVRRHVLGTDPADDVTVVHEPDQRFELDVAASRDGGWIVITAASRDSSEVRLVRADRPGEPPRVVAARRPGVEYAVAVLPGGWDGTGPEDRLLIVTDDGAPEFRLVEAAIPAAGDVGDPAGWRPVPGVSVAGERLESATVLAGHVVLAVRGQVEPFLRVLPRDTGRDGAGRDGAGGEGAVDPREPGSAWLELRAQLPFGQLSLWRAEEYRTDVITVVEENLITPKAWFEVDLRTGHRRELKRTAVPGTDLDRYATTRIEALSTGGARVPVTLAYRPDARPDADAAAADAADAAAAGGCLLYGYGAYEACEWPAFAVTTLSLLDRGAVFAVAHVRGGGERGRGWWQDGRLRAKQHTVDDFLAVRDALVQQGWADGARIASRGLSAGGLLQAAAFSQAPEKWRAVVAEVPFVDVVTTMSDPSIPLTVNEWDEWGNPADRDDFAAMLAYSPYDNPPAAGGRPALLVTGALHDPRVLVHEPAKWVARLRATDPDADPARLLLRVELGQGAHVGPSGRFAHLTYEAEILAWILAQLAP